MACGIAGRAGDIGGLVTKEHSPINPTTPDAIRLAKTLVRTARFGALGVLDAKSSAPAVSRVSVATDEGGTPVILISRLSPHFQALEAHSSASLLLGEPGKGDPLAHPRITLNVFAEMLSGAERDAQRWRFLQRHPKAGLYADFADFSFWRLAPVSASLNGGFGKAFELSAEEVQAAVLNGLSDMAQGAVDHMNEDHLDALALYAQHFAGAGPGDWRLATLDGEGMDLILGDAVARVWFDPPLRSPEELQPRLVAMAQTARDT